VFQWDLGKRYLTGDGVEPDLETARKWISLAAKQGHKEAQRKLSQLEGRSTTASRQGSSSTNERAPSEPTLPPSTGR
jgi:TPR repeat protein